MPYTSRTALKEDADADVVVIGGGITGVSTAYHCVKAGFKTILIEKDTIAFGSAGRNGGMVVEGMELDFNEAIEEFGLKIAKDLWEHTIEARKLVESVIKDNKIDCDLENPGSLYVSRSDSDDRQLRMEAEKRTESGFVCEMIENGRQLERSPFSTALFNPSDLLLHPVKFIRGLAEVAERSGLRIYEHTPALDFDAHKVITLEGVISSKRVVVAIESANSNMGQGVKIVRSQAVVTEPLSKEKWDEIDWQIGGMLWTTGEEYISCRKIGIRLFACKNLPINPTKEELIDNENWQITKLLSFFPTLKKEGLRISHRWSGLMVSTSDYHPHIQNNNGYYEIFGHSGNGLTNGMLTGKLLTDHFTGLKIPEIYQ